MHIKKYIYIRLYQQLIHVGRFHSINYEINTYAKEYLNSFMYMAALLALRFQNVTNKKESAQSYLFKQRIIQAQNTLNIFHTVYLLYISNINDFYRYKENLERFFFHHPRSNH